MSVLPPQASNVHHLPGTSTTELHPQSLETLRLNDKDAEENKTKRDLLVQEEGMHCSVIFA